MSPIYDLSPASSPNTSVNITEDKRGPATSLTGSPFSVTATSSIVLPANANRATATIINTGPAAVLLKEGSAPTATSYTYLLQPYRMWEPDYSFRFTDSVHAITTSGTASVVVSESVIIS
jgi:hypothetical protein